MKFFGFKFKLSTSYQPNYQVIKDNEITTPNVVYIVFRVINSIYFSQYQL